MSILLDTCVYLWILEGSSRLTLTARERLNEAYPRYVSAITFAEIEIKRSIGKLRVPDDYRRELEKIRLSILEFACEDSIPLSNLPFHHKDPFDRMLISQSIVRKLPIMTNDPVFENYEINVMRI